MIYQRAQQDFSLDLAARGHHVVYRSNETNRCPGCGRGQWYVGRMTAECGFCGTAVPLAEAKWSGSSSAPLVRPSREAPATLHKGADWAERRRDERIDAHGRTLQLLIDGSPRSFALHNLSAGGAMGEDQVGLAPMSLVHVRFESGILVPAEVRWVEGSLTGLSFTSPLLLDRSNNG